MEIRNINCITLLCKTTLILMLCGIQLVPFCLNEKKFIFSIVVFNDECTLKVTSNDVLAIKASQLLPYINDKLLSLTNVFNSGEMDSYAKINHPLTMNNYEQEPLHFRFDATALVLSIAQK